MNLLGELKTALYRKPKDELRRFIVWGPRGYFFTSKWQAEMEEAAKVLSPPKVPDGAPVRRVHFLCGNEHWYQAAFCAWSYQQHSRLRIVPVLVGDGTLDEKRLGWFRRLFPETMFEPKKASDERFAEVLPRDRYPNVHALRERQTLFRKLTDVYGVDDEWRMLFDADMLFFGPPREIDGVLETGEGFLVQKDCRESYGYSRRLTESLTGVPLPPAINIGMLHYNGRMTDWDRVEHWLGVLEEKEGRVYNVTQCTFAMLLAGRSVTFLDSEKYHVHDLSPRNLAAGRIAEHYVADSKPWYFHDAWRLALKSGQRTQNRVAKGTSSDIRLSHRDCPRMSLGRLTYLTLHRPIGVVKRSLREGGPIEQWKTERGRREMEAAAWQLQALGIRHEACGSAREVGGRNRAERTVGAAGDGPKANRLEQSDSRAAGSPGGEIKSEVGGQRSEVGGQRSEVRGQSSDVGGQRPLEIHMLVGNGFWFMAAFAVVSLQRQLGRQLHMHFYDDGSLGRREADKLRGICEVVTMHARDDLDGRIEELLPEEKFPFIRERLRNYHNLKKLVDPHLAKTGEKLVMDADLLYFGQPTELLDWWEDAQGILVATDHVESYGYSRPLMERLAGARIPHAINVGITGLRSETLDWELIEAWCRELIGAEKTSYYLEQALIAMLCARNRFTQLRADRYLTGPSDTKVLEADGVMQHYVDISKKNYFRHAWRRFALSG